MPTLTSPRTAPSAHGAVPATPPAASRGVRAGGVVAAAGAALGAAVALGLLDDPNLHSAVLEAATGSAGTVLATLTAYLFVRRMHRTHAVADVVLSAGVTVLAVVNAFGAVLPNLESARSDASARLVVAIGAGMVLALGLAAAAAAGERRVATLRRADVLYVAGLAAGLAVVAAGAVMVDAVGAPVEAVGRQSPAVLVADALATALAATAAALLVRRSRDGDPFVLWLAVAAAVTAVAHLSDGLVPWSSAEHLTGGDIVQVAGWVALLVAGARDFELAHRRQTADAVVDERRRLARELHDGLAQELVYISAETRRLGAHPGAERLAEAAERALEESRAAIVALSQPPDEPLERTFESTARRLGDRWGVDVSVAVRPGLDVAPHVRQALLRILREAIANAIRHGDAGAVRVSLDGPSPLVMAVADDGSGFDLLAVRRPGSHGLTSMRERAENLGGALSIQSVPGAGTTVAVVLP